MLVVIVFMVFYLPSMRISSSNIKYFLSGTAEIIDIIKDRLLHMEP